MMKKTKKTDNKPIIETIINSVALGLTSLGMVKLTTGLNIGFCFIAFGVGLEFFKYWGRKSNYW